MTQRTPSCCCCCCCCCCSETYSDAVVWLLFHCPHHRPLGSGRTISAAGRREGSTGVPTLHSRQQGGTSSCHSHAIGSRQSAVSSAENETRTGRAPGPAVAAHGNYYLHSSLVLATCGHSAGVEGGSSDPGRRRPPQPSLLRPARRGAHHSLSLRGAAKCLISQSPWAAAYQGFSDLSRHRSLLAALADPCGSRPSASGVFLPSFLHGNAGTAGPCPAHQR
eukprot:COSAG01_NODE_14406_length_1458_cov_3.033848_2_plen_221_part_00